MSARLVGALMVTLMGRQCLLRVSLSVSLGVISERKTRSITRTSEIESVQSRSEPASRDSYSVTAVAGRKGGFPHGFRIPRLR